MKSEFLLLLFSFFFRIGKCVFTLLVKDWKKAQSTFAWNFRKLLGIWKMKMSKVIFRIKFVYKLNVNFL